MITLLCRPKDVALHVIGVIGTGGGTGCVIEFARHFGLAISYASMRLDKKLEWRFNEHFLVFVSLLCDVSSKITVTTMSCGRD